MISIDESLLKLSIIGDDNSKRCEVFFLCHRVLLILTRLIDIQQMMALYKGVTDNLFLYTLGQKQKNNDHEETWIKYFFSILVENVLYSASKKWIVDRVMQIGINMRFEFHQEK